MSAHVFLTSLLVGVLVSLLGFFVYPEDEKGKIGLGVGALAFLAVLTWLVNV